MSGASGITSQLKLESPHLYDWLAAENEVFPTEEKHLNLFITRREVVDASSEEDGVNASPLTPLNVGCGLRQFLSALYHPCWFKDSQYFAWEIGNGRDKYF